MVKIIETIKYILKKDWFWIFISLLFDYFLYDYIRLMVEGNIMSLFVFLPIMLTIMVNIILIDTIKTSIKNYKLINKKSDFRW